jgi:hypothetical protein
VDPTNCTNFDEHKLDKHKFDDNNRTITNKFSCPISDANHNANHCP